MHKKEEEGNARKRNEMEEEWKGGESVWYSYPSRYENHNAFLIIVGGKVESVGIYRDMGVLLLVCVRVEGGWRGWRESGWCGWRGGVGEVEMFLIVKDVGVFYYWYVWELREGREGVGGVGCEVGGGEEGRREEICILYFVSYFVSYFGFLIGSRGLLGWDGMGWDGEGCWHAMGWHGK